MVQFGIVRRNERPDFRRNMTRVFALRAYAIIALLFLGMLGATAGGPGVSVADAPFDHHAAAKVASQSLAADRIGVSEHRGCPKTSHSQTQTNTQAPGLLGTAFEGCAPLRTALLLPPPASERRSGLSPAPEPSPPKYLPAA